MGATVLVIGASGALGSHLSAALAADDGLVVLRGVRSQAGDGEIVVDVEDEASIEAAVAGIDLAVVAVPQKQPLVQRVCARSGVASVDVSPHGELRDLAQRELAGSRVPAIMMCGLYPGLSGILASHVAAELDEVSEIAIGLLQSTNAKVGATGVKDMLRTLCQPVPTTTGTRPGFSRRRRMRFGPATATVRLMRYDEREVLRERFTDSEVAYFTAWSSTGFTTAIATLKRVGLLARLANSRLDLTPKHNPRKPQTVHLAVAAHGRLAGASVTRTVSVEADSDYGATALAVAAVARHALDNEDALNGVLTPLEFMRLEDLTAMFDGGHMTLSTPV